MGEIRVNTYKPVPSQNGTEHTSLDAAADAGFLVLTTAVILDRQAGAMYLAVTRQEAAGSLWLVGGRMQPNETPEQSMARCFRQATTLSCSERQFTLLQVNTCPRGIDEGGVHTFVYVFAVELHLEDRGIAERHLDLKAYSACNARKSELERLVADRAHPMLIDLYQQVFPQYEQGRMMRLPKFSRNLTVAARARRHGQKDLSVVTKEDDMVIAEVRGNHATGSNPPLAVLPARDNAFLFAAAPELYAACLKALRVLFKARATSVIAMVKTALERAVPPPSKRR